MNIAKATIPITITKHNIMANTMVAIPVELLMSLPSSELLPVLTGNPSTVGTCTYIVTNSTNGIS